MNIVRPLVRFGCLVTMAGLTFGCSSQPAGSASDAADEGARGVDGTNLAAMADAADDAGSLQGQGQGTPQEQRLRATIAQSLQDAERAMQMRLWGDAARIAGEVLDLDPANQRAREILYTAQDLLGERAPSVTRTAQDRINAARVAVERDRDRARYEMAMGDANMEAGRYGDAEEAYQRGLLVLRYSAFLDTGSQLESELQAKLSSARAAKARAQQDADDRARAASRAQLEEEENRIRIQRAARVKRLLDAANLEFQNGDYAAAVRHLDLALQEEPSNEHARALQSLASRARHDQAVQLARQQWKAEWARTFDDLRTLDVPQTDAIQYDMARWAEVAMRQPLSFAPAEELDSPEDVAIRQKLATQVHDHRFAGPTPVLDWARYYQTLSEVTFHVSQEVRDMDPDTTTLEDFSLPGRTIEQALDAIKAQTGVHWKVQNGMVMLVGAESARGRMYLNQYQVTDLIRGVANKPGRELKLSVPGEDPPFDFGDGDEPKPTVLDESRLETIIRDLVPGAFDDPDSSIEINRHGVMIVRQTREVHRAIATLLQDLRQAVGILVDIEARFLKVEDSFLEDVGVDFRGLGDQTSGGVPGRGLERNNRQGFRFDDYGQPQQTSPAAPGEIGTGTEPGIFFDDGGDGDYAARTENLFDTTVGGGPNELDNAGGLSLQYTLIDDTELEVILRAVEKHERSEFINAPRLMIYNNTRANMSVLRHTSFIKDFEVEIAQSAAVANPVVDVVRDGVVLDVKPVVSADRRFITMELRPTVMELQLPIPTFVTTLGVGQPISIQLPRATLQRVRTTVTMPDGATVMLGGMKLAEKSHQVSGVPILKDLPGLSFLFSRKGTFIQNKKILILVRAQVVMPADDAPLPPPDELTQVLQR